MTRITTATVFGLALLLGNMAHADVLDDNLVKAEKSFTNAQLRLDKAKACIANRPICLADLTAKAERAAKRAADKLAAYKTADQQQ